MASPIIPFLHGIPAGISANQNPIVAKHASVHAAVVSQFPDAIVGNTPATPKAADPSLNTLHVVTPDGSAYLQNVGGLLHYVNPPSNVAKPLFDGSGTPFTPKVENIYDITVLRKTAALATSLGYVIGAADEMQNNFYSIIAGIPNQNSGSIANLSWTASFDGSGNLILTYTNGTLTDILQVSCAQMSMATLANRLNRKRYHVSLTRLNFSDSTQAAAQFSTSIGLFKRKESGGANSDPLGYISQQNTYQNIPQKVDVNGTWYLSHDECFFGTMIADAGASLVHSLFVSQNAAYDIN